MMISILLTICIIGLIIGSITDLRTREVPDWLNYALIFAGLGLRTLFSTIEGDWIYIIEGLLGFGVFYLIALLMYYTGQWGGGDSKMLMGLGALIGLQLTIDSFLLSFFINLLFAGAAYGILWMGFLIATKWKYFLPDYKILHKANTKPRIASLIAGTALLTLAFFVPDIRYKILLLILGTGIPATIYLWMTIKAVEKSCMIKTVAVSKLTEGDWIVDPIKANGKILCGPKDLGITKEQIALLKKHKIQKAVIKEGIPFVPSFLLSFILTLGFGNILLVFI